jgi:non-heme chloroperoxidase
MRLALLILAFETLTACQLSFSQQDIAGNWQGTIKYDSRESRVIIQISKSTSGWTGQFFSIDQSPDGIPIDFVIVKDSSITLPVTAIRSYYVGKIDTDGNSIRGNWTQFGTFPLNLMRATNETAWKPDESPHTVHSITVDKGVDLEVLDWGGSGKAVVLLAGLGANAHIFDRFAPKLAADYHVYGITRRGFGKSSAPLSGYSADRLGDDVIAVMNALKLDRPVLVGHSIAGEELSSVGSRHPDKVSGLIYLEAGYSHAFYDQSVGDYEIDLIDLKEKLERIQPGQEPQDSMQMIKELESIQGALPRLEKNLQYKIKELITQPAQSRNSSIWNAIMAGKKRFTDIRVPALAIFAIPKEGALDAEQMERRTQQMNAFEKGIPSARVVRLQNAAHSIFLSNEAEVLREIKAFLGSLP